MRDPKAILQLRDHLADNNQPTLGLELDLLAYIGTRLDVIAEQLEKVSGNLARQAVALEGIEAESPGFGG